jgi:hypothetical protein
MTTIIDAVSVPTVSEVQNLSEPTTVYIRGLNGGEILIELSPDVDPPKWGIVYKGIVIPVGFTLCPKGDYKLRATVLTVTPTTLASVILSP